MIRNSPDPSSRLEAAMRAAAQAFLASLDGLEESPRTPPAATATAAGELIQYDPLVDPVPLPQDPAHDAPRAHKGMASVTYVGAIARINATEGRGATTDEVRKYALKAGYPDARAVNGWADRPGSEDRAIKNIDGLRYVKADSLEWLHGVAAEIGIKLVGDYSPPPIPPQ